MSDWAPFMEGTNEPDDAWPEKPVREWLAHEAVRRGHTSVLYGVQQLVESLDADKAELSDALTRREAQHRSDNRFHIGRLAEADREVTRMQVELMDAQAAGAARALRAVAELFADELGSAGASVLLGHADGIENGRIDV